MGRPAFASISVMAVLVVPGCLLMVETIAMVVATLQGAYRSVLVACRLVASGLVGLCPGSRHIGRVIVRLRAGRHRAPSCCWRFVMFRRVFVVCCLLMTACGSTADDELAPRPAVEAVGGAAPTTTTPEPQPEPVASAAPMLDIEFSITPVATDVDAGGKGSGRLQWRVLGATSVELIFPSGRSTTVEPVDGLDINFPKGSYRYTLVAIKRRR